MNEIQKIKSCLKTLKVHKTNLHDSERKCLEAMDYLKNVKMKYGTIDPDVIEDILK